MPDTQNTTATTTNASSATMESSVKPVITFYDIILDPASYPMSPNPWKTRYVLNFCKVPYRTEWVPLPKVGSTRDSFRLAANRKHMDGSDFPTLPIIRDQLCGADAVVGDSFDIALHLQRTHLSAPSFPSTQTAALFPGYDKDGGSVALHRAFNFLVDQLFTEHGAVLGGYYMPFDPRTADADKADMMSRFPGDRTWEDLCIPAGSETRGKMLQAFEQALDAKLSPCFPAGAGPFMDGRGKPMYADFIVGGWLQFMRGCLPEWDQLRDSWSGGKWGRLFDALEEWTAVDGREGVVPARR